MFFFCILYKELQIRNRPVHWYFQFIRHITYLLVGLQEGHLSFKVWFTAVITTTVCAQ